MLYSCLFNELLKGKCLSGGPLGNAAFPTSFAFCVVFLWLLLEMLLTRSTKDLYFRLLIDVD